MLCKTAQELKPLLLAEGRLLGLDVGEKTIGLSLSDLRRQIATPYETLKRGKFTQDAERMRTIIKEQLVCGLVIGFPVNMDGSLGPKCQSVSTFASNLMGKFALPILLWDERMSTMAVTRTMLDADMSRARRAEIVDKLAASYILQGALDLLNRA